MINLDIFHSADQYKIGYFFILFNICVNDVFNDTRSQSSGPSTNFATTKNSALTSLKYRRLCGDGDLSLKRQEKNASENVVC